MRWLRAIWCAMRGHRWNYAGTGNFTGYIERCDRCDEIVQIPQ